MECHTSSEPRRSKRKLCYPAQKENSSKQRAGELLLEDVSKMFDDLDSASHDDVIPPSPPLETGNKQVLTEEVLNPTTRSPSPKLHIDLDILFKGQGPVKTSSPIEGDINTEHRANEKDQTVSPIHCLCKEETRKEELPIQGPLCNGHTTEDSLPPKIVLSKPKSTNKEKVELPDKGSQTGAEQIPTKSQIPVLVSKQKTQRQENTDVPIPTMKTENVLTEPTAEMSNRVGKEMTAFLQKLRDAGQPKVTVSRKSELPVQAPTCPPTLEDDFLILENDAPIRFTISSEHATKRRQMLNKTSSTDKDSSTDKGMKDVCVSVEMPQEQQEPDQKSRKLQNVNLKRKKKEKEKQKEVTETGNDKDEWSTPEDLPAGDLVKKDKPNKKIKRHLEKKSDKAKDKPEDTPGRETEEEENSTKPQKSSEAKRSKSPKKKKEKAKTSKAKSLKQRRKETQGSDGVKETMKVQRSSEEDADVEDLTSPSDKELRKSELQTPNRKTKQTKQSAVFVGSSFDDSQVATKRKRNPPGHWWLLSPNSMEETKVTDNQLIRKRSKQNRMELAAQVSSPVEDKNDGPLKKTHQNTNKKKIKQNKRRTTGGNNSDKMKAGVFQEHQDPAHSNPLVFSHRDHSSGDQISQYHRSNCEKISSTLALPVSSGRPSEQLDKCRRRKPPCEWWKVEDTESISSQPQHLNPKEPKPRKERKTWSKQSRSPQLGTPKKGKRAVLSKPPGGAPIVLLKANGSPQTVRDASPPAEDSDGECEAVKDILSMDAGELNHNSSQTTKRHSTSTVLRSGLSSFIELEQHEENDERLLSNRVLISTLSMLDLCAPPLKPLCLQLKDKVDLAQWLKNLWPATANNRAEITPEDFDWYFYQGRAIGFMQDLQSGSILNGKMLLGSYMKKPLWVDHNATTVFNVLTSSVILNIDYEEFHFDPGRSFMVQCGHAYSIQNLTALPAVLCFTRILAESPA